MHQGIPHRRGLTGADGHAYLGETDAQGGHKLEAMFKAFAKALDAATRRDARIDGVLSTKGTLYLSMEAQNYGDNPLFGRQHNFYYFGRYPHDR